MRIRFVRSIRENPSELILAIGLYSIIIIFIVYPLAVVFAETFRASSGFTLANYVDYFSDPFYLKCFFNSIVLGLAVVVATTLLGVPLAYVLARYKIRFKSLLTAFCMLPIVMPPFIGAYAFIYLLGTHGTINLLLMDWGIIQKPINFLYGVHGIILIETIHLVPFIILTASSAITNIDASLEEAAEIEGSSGLRRFLTVTFPLARPSYMAGAFLVFIFTLADWLTPIVVGQTRYLSSNAYIDVAYQFLDIHRRRMGLISCVLASSLSIVTLLAVRKYVELKSYVALTKGTTMEGRVFEVSGLKKASAYALVVLMIVLALLSPFTITIGAFSRAWSFSAFPTQWTLENFKLAFISAPQYIENSFLYSGIAILIGLVTSLSIAYFLARTKAPGRDLMDGIVTMILALPGIVIGAGYMLGFGGEIPFLGFSLARIWVVMPVVVAIRRLPYLVRSSYASFLQLDRSLEEASEIEGASRFRTFLNISVPLIRRGVFAGALMMFVMSMQEISATIFLYKAGWETIPIGIFTLWHRGSEFAYAASLSFMLVVIVGILILIASRLGARILGGAFAA